MNHIKPLSDEQLNDMFQHCEDVEDDDNDYQEYFRYVCENELQVTLTTNWRDATELYEQLLTIAVAR